VGQDDSELVPAPDHYDCDNGSATATYEGNWSIVKGGSGIFYFSHNDTDDAGNTLISIDDETIPYFSRSSLDDTGETRMVPANASETVRNISVSMLLYDGVYSTDPGILLSGAGWYYPSVQRGVSYLIYAYGYIRPKVELNQSFLEPYLLNTIDTWPPSMDPEAAELFTEFTPDAEANLTAGLTSIRDCVFMLYFTTSRTSREVAPHRYPPDSQASLLREGSDVDGTLEQVPSLQLRLIGNTSLVDFSVTSPIINRGRETRQALEYSAVMIVGCMVMLIIGVYTVTTSSSPLKLEFISMTSLVLQLVYDLMMSVQSVTMAGSIGLGSNCLLLVTLAYGAFCFVVDYTFLMRKYLQHQQRARRAPSFFRMMCMMILVYVGFFVAVIIQQYVPYKARFFVELVLFSFWFAQGIFTLARRKQRYGFTYAFVLVTTIVRLCPLIYFYSYSENFLHWEAEGWYFGLALGWGGAQTVFLLVVMITARRAFNASAKGHPDFYQYVDQPISTVMLDEVEEGVLYTLEAGAEAPGTEDTGAVAVAPRPSPLLGSSSSAEVEAPPAMPLEVWERALSAAAAAGYNCIVPYKHYMGYLPAEKKEVTGPPEERGRVLPGPDEPEETSGAELADADPDVAVAASASGGPRNAPETPKAPESPAHHTVCLNPLHLHSPLYTPDLTARQFFRSLKSLPLAPGRQHLPVGDRGPFSSLDSTHILCFTLTSSNSLWELAACTICLDNIALRPENLLLVSQSAPAARSQELAAVQKAWPALTHDGDKGSRAPRLWMTPCGHCFHDSCLARWTEENLQCPVDREPIPVPTETPV